MDAWYKPVVDVPLTEPRWVRAIEMRPGTIKGRKITHHALAYLMQDEKEAVASGLISADNDSGAGLFMEWAVNKEGEMMRPNTGKLLMPGAKIRWDIHYSAGGEDIDRLSADGHLPVSERPGAEVPHHAVALQRRHRRQPQPRHRAELDQRRPELPRDAQGRPRRELPAAHAPARQGDDGRSDPAERHSSRSSATSRTSSSTG